MKKNYFTKAEIALWSISCAAIVSSYLLLDGGSIATPAASVLGVTSLIFNAKGNPIGQALMIVFSLFYGAISWGCAYYGEMATYLGMTAPMAVAALISWLRHPFGEGHAEVQVNRLPRREHAILWPLTAVVTAIFYFILRAWNTANLAVSTVSVTTSFVAVYLTFRRSPYYALGYAANDLVLIVLWTMSALEDRSYLSVVVCFLAFLANDLYGFLSWKRMERRQRG